MIWIGKAKDRKRNVAEVTREVNFYAFNLIDVSQYNPSVRIALVLNEQKSVEQKFDSHTGGYNQASFRSHSHCRGLLRSTTF